MNGTKQGNKQIYLTKSLLSLIIAVQGHGESIRKENIFRRDHGLSIEKDWWKEEQRFFNSIPKDVLARYYLRPNLNSFEKVHHYKVTEAMLKTEEHELPLKFMF